MGVGTPAVRALSTFSHVDYEDACVVEAERAQDRSAQGWARAMLEEASPETRARLRSVWFALGLKLGPADAEDRVLGWEVPRSSPDFVILAADARLGMSAEVIVQRRRRTLLGATFLQHHNPLARLIWLGVAPHHRRAVRGLLASAVRRSERA